MTTFEWSIESVDREARLLKGMSLCGATSKNGYTFMESAFGDSAGIKALYEDRPVFWDHDPNPLSRSARQIAGIVVNPRREGQRIVGDILCYQSENGDALLALGASPRPPKGVGLSHVARYEFEGRSRKTVKKVAEVVSVDVVVNPATNSTMREQTDMDETKYADLLKEQATTAAALQAKTAEVETLKAEAVAQAAKLAEANETISALRTENTGFKVKVDQYEAEQALLARKAAVAGQLKEANLNQEDTAIVTPVFLEQLYACADEAARKALIDDRVALARATLSTEGNGKVFSPKRVPTTPASDFDADKFLKELN